MTPESVAGLLVLGAGIYLAVGALFALAFVTRGAPRIDPQARQGTLGFRLLILPAAAALWPYLAIRWRRGTLPPEERNAHRRAARPAGGTS